MKFTSKYPALVRGRVKRMTSDRLILCLPETTFEIPEIRSAEAPVAIVANVNGKEIEYRLHEGELYTPLMPAKTFERLADPQNASLISPRHPLFGPIIRDISDQVGFRRVACETRPENLYSVLGCHTVDPALVMRASSDAANLVETEFSLAQLAVWREKAAKRIGGIILIDGHAFERSIEPCYQLACHCGTVSLSDGGLFSRPTNAARAVHEWENLGYRYFSALDGDRIVECAGRLSRNDASLDEVRLTVFIPEALTTNFADLDVDRFSRVCVMDFEKHVTRRLGWNDDALRDIPGDLMLNACRLRDATASRDVYDEVTEELVSALETYRITLGYYPQIMEDMNFVEMQIVEDVIAGWRERRSSVVRIPAQRLA